MTPLLCEEGLRWALIGSTSENTWDSFELISNGARTGDANGGGSFRPRSREWRGVSGGFIGVVWAAASPRASRSER